MRASWIPFSTAGHELPRNRTAEDVVLELEVAAARQRLHADLAVAELPVAARLLLVAAVCLGGGRDGLAVRDPGRLQVHLYAEAPLQLGDRDFDVELALAGQQQLVRLRVARVADRRIFLPQPLHRRADLVLVAAALRLDGVGEHRLGKLDLGELHGGGLLGQHVVRLGFLQLGDGPEIARLQLGHVRVGLALEGNQVAEPLGGVVREVVHRRVRLQRSRDDAQHRDAAGERIGDGLPHERHVGRRCRTP